MRYRRKKARFINQALQALNNCIYYIYKPNAGFKKLYLLYPHTLSHSKTAELGMSFLIVHSLRVSGSHFPVYVRTDENVAE